MVSQQSLETAPEAEPDTRSTSGINFKFLGVGDASQQGLGHASACVEINMCAAGSSESKKVSRLLIDLGPGVLDAFLNHYACLPDAVFITHCHLDHIADFEKLFIKAWFGGYRPFVFVPVEIIKLLHERVGTYPGALAEGGVNFWQAFQLIPVMNRFEFADICFDVYPARHHGLNSAYSLCVPETFYYTGDTRPVPEILETLCGDVKTIFHDCSILGNPSHSGIEDLRTNYSKKVLEKIFVYHYNTIQQKQMFIDAGLNCVEPGQQFSF